MRRVLALAAGLLMAAAPAAPAATINVDTRDDGVSNDGHCSLREAISSANLDSAPFNGPGECQAGSGADTVVLADGAPFTLSGAARDDANASGDLDVTSTVTLQGAGASLTTVDANGVDRVIDVLGAGNLTLQGVTITGGRAPVGLNAGSTSTGSAGAPASKGGDAAGGTGNPGESGGGVRSAGTLTVLDSTVSGNRAGDGRNGGNASAGAGRRRQRVDCQRWQRRQRHSRRRRSGRQRRRRLQHREPDPHENPRDRRRRGHRGDRRRRHRRKRRNRRRQQRVRRHRWDRRRRHRRSGRRWGRDRGGGRHGDDRSVVDPRQHRRRRRARRPGAGRARRDHHRVHGVWSGAASADSESAGPAAPAEAEAVSGPSPRARR